MLDISYKRGDLASRVNKMIGSLHGAQDDVLLKVFSSKCCHFYGSSAWRLRDNSIKDFHTMYNRSVRRILSLPYRTHTRLLPLITSKANSSYEIHARFVKMVFAASECDNKLIKYITNHAMSKVTSIIGSNLDYIRMAYSLNKTAVRHYNFRKHYERTVTIEEQCVAYAIKDLMNNLVDFGDFHANMIFELCVS